MDGNFRKRRARMPFFPTRSAPKPLPISLVKPAEKLQPESGLLLFSEFHL